MSDRQKLYNADGTFANKYLKINAALHAQRNHPRNTKQVVSYDALIKSANNLGLFTKSQLKGMKKGQVIVCKSPEESNQLSLVSQVVDAQVPEKIQQQDGSKQDISLKSGDSQTL